MLPASMTSQDSLADHPLSLSYKASKAVGRLSLWKLVMANISVSELLAVLDLPEETPLDDAKLVGAMLKEAALEA
jgi:hypothetical protein